MPFDPGLAERLAEFLASRRGFQEKKMFGGIGWMLNGNMCVGVYKDWLIIRVGEGAMPKLLKEKNVKPMDITGKPMKGWAMAGPIATAEDRDLERYVMAAIAFVKDLPAKK